MKTLLIIAALSKGRSEILIRGGDEMMKLWRMNVNRIMHNEEEMKGFLELNTKKTRLEQTSPEKIT